MSYNIPSEQWAQVVEKTGGPVKYKKIPVQKPGPNEVLINIKYSGKLPVMTYSFLKLKTKQVFAIPTCTQSTVTGHWPPSFHLLVATRVLVLSLQRAVLSRILRSVIMRV